MRSMPYRACRLSSTPGNEAKSNSMQPNSIVGHAPRDDPESRGWHAEHALQRLPTFVDAWERGEVELDAAE